MPAEATSFFVQIQHAAPDTNGRLHEPPGTTILTAHRQTTMRAHWPAMGISLNTSVHFQYFPSQSKSKWAAKRLHCGWGALELSGS